MVLTSFSQEEYEQTIRDESYREGIEQGIKNLITSLKHLEISKEKIFNEIKTIYELSEEQAQTYIKKYWEDIEEAEK